MQNATKVGGVYIAIEGDNSGFKRELRQAQTEAERGGRRIGAGIDKASSSVRDLDREVGRARIGLAALFGTAAVAAFGAAVVQASDAFTLMRARLSLVVKEGENLLTVEKQLYDQSLKNRSDLDATIALYVRLRQAQKDLNNETTLAITDTWAKTLIVSGASAEEAAAATRQFAQAMASGRLQGDELRSILEGNSRFARLLSDNLGITIGELREFGEAGKLTTSVIVGAMTTGADELRAEFEKIPVTVGQAMTNVGTAFVRYVGLIDQATGASATLAGFINSLANNFDAMMSVVIVASATLGTGFATVAVGKAIIAMNALIARGAVATATMGGLNAVLNLIRAHPVLIGLTAITSAMAFMAVTAQDVEDRIASANDAMAKYRDTQASIEEDTLALTKAQDALKMAIESQGPAAQSTAALEVDAIQKRIDKNKELARVYEALARSQLADAQKLLEKRERNLERRVRAGQKRDKRGRRFVNYKDADTLREEIFAAQDRGQRLSPDQRKLLRLFAEVEQARADVEAAQKALDALDQPIEAAAGGGIQQLPTTVSTESKAAKTRKGSASDRIGGDVSDLAQKLAFQKQLRQELEMEYKIDLARAELRAAEEAGVESLIDAAEQKLRLAEDEQATLRLTGDLIRAGYSAEEARTMAAAQVLAIRQAETQELRSQFGLLGEMAQSVAGRAGDAGGDALEDQSREIETLKRDISRAFTEAIRTGDFGEAFEQVVFNAVNRGLEDAIMDGLDLLFKALLDADWSGLFGGSPGTTGGIISAVASAFSFGGARASGGPVSGMRSYIVGEKGPEMFIPGSDGFIVPKQKMPDVSSSSLNGGQSISVRGGDVIVQGDASEKTLALIQRSQEAFAQQLPSVIRREVQDGQRRGRFS